MKTILKYLLIISSLLPINAKSMEFEGDIELLSKMFINTSFQNADFTSASLVGNNLSGVDFRGTNLTGANLTGTILKDVKMNEQTKFDGAIGWCGALKIEKMSNGQILLQPIYGAQIPVNKGNRPADDTLTIHPIDFQTCGSSCSTSL